MPNVRATSLVVAGLLSLAVWSVRGQAPALAVVAASPTGELRELADTDQIRIVFSEPMIALGSVPAGTAPPWIHMTPAAAGSFFWSGTRTLIFSPDVSTPLPYATTFTLRVDASAASVAGRTLAAPYVLTFTTPTVRLLAADWYRKTGRFDSPAVIALRFNQPMRPADVVAHARVALQPHVWAGPKLLAPARERWRRSDPAGLRAFDDKVAAVRRATSLPGTVAVRAATTWDEERFPPEPERVVMETEAAPPTDGWLRITLDEALPSPGGPVRQAAQSTTVRLDATFFVAGAGCELACRPGDQSVAMTQSVPLGAFARALTIVDMTNGAKARPVTRTRAIDVESARSAGSVGLRAAGFPLQPAARTWRLALDRGLQADDGQTLGYSWVGSIATLHERSFVAFEGSVWEASGGPSIPLNGRNVRSISQRLEPVERSAVMARLLELEQRPPSPFKAAGPAHRLRMTPDIVQTHGLDLRRLLSPRGTGVVWADVMPADVLSRFPSPPGTTFYEEVSTGGVRSSGRRLVQVTNLGITVKESPQSTLVFVTRLDTGVPVADAQVAIVDTKNLTRWRGATDRDGVALGPALAIRPLARERQVQFMVTAEKAGDFAFVGSDWTAAGGRGIADGPSEAAGVLRGSVFTDRGVYKQAEEVHLKAVLRADTDAGMRMFPPGTAVEMVITDERGREVERRSIGLTGSSSAEWTWRVPADAALGHYQVELSRTGTKAWGEDASDVSGTFLVAAYRRPEFRVETALGGDPPVLGSTLRGIVGAKYLFGGALGRQPVRWSITRAPAQRPPDAVLDRFPADRYATGYLPREKDRPEPDEPEPKAGALGADGRAVIDLPTRAEPDVAYLYTFEGDVEDVSGQHIASRASLVVHPASLYVAMSRPPMFVESRTGATVGLSAVDLSGRSVDGVELHVSLLHEQWLQAPRSTEWQRREIPAGEWTVRSASGETPLPIPVPGGGRYLLRAIARDAAGRQTRTEVAFYALGSGLSRWHDDGSTLELTPERTMVKPGETARILVKSPWERATALLTVEREGIRSHRTIAITSTQTSVEVPITEGDIPNVFVSVLLVKGRTSNTLDADGSDPGRPGYRVGYTNLTVDDASKRLRVTVTSDRAEYRPRQAATVSVAVAAPGGAPVAGEVTLWAVDAAVLSLTGYTTPDVLKSIYVPRNLHVMTADSRARLMSRGVMPPPFEWFNDGLIQTQSAERSFSVAGQDVPVDSPDAVRRDFRPLVVWLGSAAAGADGRVTTTVTLPDSLTTYRIMAVAGSDGSQFGSGEHEVRVSKPLTLLPAFPRFLSTGDHASFGAVVTNGGIAPGSAVVTIQSLDPGTLQFGAASQTIRLDPGASQAVRFDAVAAATGEARVRITAALGEETDAFEMPLTVRLPLPETTAAYGETLSTATERIVLPPGVSPEAGGLTVELASTALVGLGEGVRYLVEYPHECAEQKSSRALALLVSSDLGGAFKLAGVNPGDERARAERALGELSGFQCHSGGFSLWPGQCGTESAYLTAYVLHVMKVAGTLSPQRAEDARRGPRPGAAVDNDVVVRALDYLERKLRDEPPADGWRPMWAASQAYSAKVLAEFGRKPEAAITRLAGMAEHLPIFALSYLADALAATNDRGPRYHDLLQRITNALRIDADRAHVEEIDDDDILAWVWSSNVRSTAIVLDGLARRHDPPAYVAPLARWLVAARVNGRWGSTQENAAALEAFTMYYRALEADVPHMTAAVSVGNTRVGQATFNGRSSESQQVVLPMADLLKQMASAVSVDAARDRSLDAARDRSLDAARDRPLDAARDRPLDVARDRPLDVARDRPLDVARDRPLDAARDRPTLTIERTGTGRLYYTARVRSYAPEPRASVDRGIHVERRYEVYVPDAPAVRESSEAPRSRASSGGTTAAPSKGTTWFSAGDLIRVTVTVTLRGEGRYLALTDLLPAGLEPIDAWFDTTARNLSAEAERDSSSSWEWWQAGRFDHIEKHDDRVLAYATQLAAGRHELSYLARATTAGTFDAPGARVEAMYAPEVSGRSEAATVTVK